MKRLLLKSVCLTLLWLSILSQAFAQGIVVNKADGTKVYYKAADVISVGVYGYGEEPEPDPIEHEWVDLGLPSGTLWATTNVGASKPEEYGDYFAWGETIGYYGGKKTFDWSTYKFCSGSENTIWKYCTDSSYGTVDNKTMLETADDAATANWGEDWQMPSHDQYKELINSSYTTTEWTTVNGVNGWKITSKSVLKSIFLPAAGERANTSLYSVGSSGNYWSRSLCTSDSALGYYLYFNAGDIIANGRLRRYYGHSVRPVRVKK